MVVRISLSWHGLTMLRYASHRHCDNQRDQIMLAKPSDAKIILLPADLRNTLRGLFQRLPEP